jgi:hypothetical protein
MPPYRGKYFGRTNAPSLLLIGESHYLHKDRQPYDAQDWYLKDYENLPPDVQAHINTAEILETACKENFPRKGHSIWSRSFQLINENGPNFKDYRQVADYIAFYNFFLRPARCGKSLKVTDSDEDYANENFKKQIDHLKPTAVIFLSTLAYKHLSGSNKEMLDRAFCANAAP